MSLAWTFAMALHAQPAPLVAPSTGVEVRVDSDATLRAELQSARPGTTILIASGHYQGGISVEGLAGKAGQPIVVRGADLKAPPLFEGGTSAFHLRDVAYLELVGLTLRGVQGNGINVDDGGTPETAAHHVTLRRLTITDVGERGNQDGLKLSGVDDFTIEECTLERWGGGGSGIDLVGCHRGTIDGCTFRQRAGTSGSGVQAKGGSSDVTVRRCRFEEAGSRAINLGGSTGLEFFRPVLGAPPHFEAKDLLIEHNTFVGSDAPIAFVGVDGATVRFNTIHLPHRYAIRILQETTAPGFVPCRNGRFTRNLIVFRSSEWSSGGVNIGPATDPGSFEFAENWWYCSDAPTRSRPTLPTPEKDGRYGDDPRFRDSDHGDLTLRSDSPAKGYGANAPK